MTSTTGQGAVPDPPVSLAARCRELGVPTWRFDGRGVAVEEPSGWGPAEPWLRSPALRERIDRIVATWLRSEQPKTSALWAGCWALPVGEPDGGIGAALAIDAEGIADDEFEAICRSVRVDPQPAKHALASRWSDRDGLETVLRWMTHDLRVTSEQDAALRHFSREMAHDYEQISLLYRLGRSMNWLTKPQDFMCTACSCIVEMLDFAWIAVVHKVETLVETSGSTIVAGVLPCERREFDEIAEQLLSETTVDGWTSLLECDQHPAASRLGSQIVAEPVMAGGAVAGLILAGNKAGEDCEVTSIERQLLDATADYLGAFLHNVQMYEEQRSLFLGSIQALSAAIDAKDRYTRGHSERVALMGSRLAAATGMGEEQVERVRIAGLVHDVGKIGIPAAVLRKPGRLTQEEFELIKRHPVIGHTILKDIKALDDVLPGVLYHHERWDGGGYPEGLAGENIPWFGRLLAVADAFDAMSSNRAYRSALPREDVLREIGGAAGTQFDPDLAALFLTLDFSEYDAAVARHLDREVEAA